MKTYLVHLFIGLVLISCNGNKKPANSIKETAATGKIAIAVEEIFNDLFKDEVEIFEKENNKAHIEIINVSEENGIQKFLSGKVRLIATTRKLTKNELILAKQKELNPLHYFIAFDAVALVVNKECSDTSFLKKEIEQLFQGRSIKNHSIVFNSNGAGEIQFFKNLFNIKNLPANFFATNNINELSNYIESDKKAIGIIGINYILSNSDSILEKVKLVSIKNENGINYLPNEKNIRSGYYPFRREVYIICGESWPSLGTGFAKFMTTDIGQSIIKRSGLIPARLPMRMIEIKNNF